MNFEQQNLNEPFRRLENPEFQMKVREGFADLLEDRATDPQRQGGASEVLVGFAERVRRGEKIPRTPASISIFRGVFFGDGPMAEHSIVHAEIDALERNFFE